MDGKKIMAAVVVLFFGFWLFTDPNGLADAAEAAVAMTGDLFGRVLDFLGALGD